MAETQKDQTITIDDKEYKVSDLSPEQINLVNHVADLDRKLESARFNVDQLQVGRNAFMSMLTENLNKPAEETTEEAK